MRFFIILIASISSLPLMGQWILQPELSLPGFDKIYFTDENHGYGLPSNGNILKTTDGGQTWNAVYYDGLLTGLEVYFFNDLYFIDELHGFAVGYDFWAADYLILGTADGGETWTPFNHEEPSTIGELYAVDFANAQSGYAVGDYGLVFKTSNGGMNWSKVQTPLLNSRLIDVDFVNSQTGWALAFDGQLIKTTNGGNNWQSFPNAPPIDKIQFLDENIGFGKKSNKLYKTTDGGLTWTLAGQPTIGSINDYDFVDEHIGYSIQAGQMYRTGNGGQNWALQQTTGINTNYVANYSTYTIFALDENHAYAAGYFQTIINTYKTLLLKMENQGGLGINFGFSPSQLECLEDTLLVNPLFFGTPSEINWYYDGQLLSNTNSSFIFPGPWQSLEYHTLKLEVSSGLNVVTMEQGFETPYIPTPADYSWVTYGVTPKCPGLPVRIYVQGLANVSVQLILGGQVVAGPVALDGNFNNYIETPPIFDTTSFTVELLHPCGPIPIAEVTVPVLPAVDVSSPVSSNGPLLLCKTDNIVEVLVNNTQANQAYSLYQNDILIPFSSQIGNGGTISFNSNPFDSTTVFRVNAQNFTGCAEFLTDSLVIEVERPDALFGINGVNQPVGTPAVVNFAGQEAVEFNWNFGQNATPSSYVGEFPPPVDYNGETVTEISLEVVAPMGCRDTFIRNVGRYIPGGLSELWAQELSISHQEGPIRGQRMEIDNEGNIYIDGSKSDSYPVQDFDSYLPSKAGASSFMPENKGVIIKYDKYGVLLWDILYYGFNYGIMDLESDMQGNLFVQIVNGDVVIGSMDGKLQEIKGRNGSAIVKYSPEGNILWKAELHSCINGGLNLTDLETDDFGNIYGLGHADACGEFYDANGILQGTVDVFDGTNFIIKYSPEGDYIWSKAITDENGVSNIFGNGIQLDSDGNFYLCSGGYTTVIAKYDSNANYLWDIAATNDNAFFSSSNLDIDEENNVYAAGFFRQNLDLPGVPSIVGNSFHSSDYDLFVLKVDPTGEVIWLKAGDAERDYDGETAIRYHDGSVYVHGSFGEGDFNYDGHSITGESGRNGILLRIDSNNGDYQSNILRGTPNPEPNVHEYYNANGKTIEIDTSGILHIMGNIGYEVIFGADTLTSIHWLYLAKTLIPPIDTSTVIDTVDYIGYINNINWSASLAPNPAEYETALIVDANESITVDISISNQLGQKSASFSKWELSEGRNYFLLRLEELKIPKGIFYLTITDEDGNVGSLKLFHQ